jgi:hypothetical protein
MTNPHLTYLWERFHNFHGIQTPRTQPLLSLFLKENKKRPVKKEKANSVSFIKILQYNLLPQAHELITASKDEKLFMHLHSKTSIQVTMLP